MEPWSISVTVKQDSPSSQQDIKIFSGEQMNVNLTFGLAYNIMNAQERVLGKLKKIDMLINPPGLDSQKSREETLEEASKSR